MRESVALEQIKELSHQPLNDSELHCLQLTADDIKNAVIAEETTLPDNTVNAYLVTAAKKLEAVNRIQAVAGDSPWFDSLMTRLAGLGVRLSKICTSSVFDCWLPSRIEFAGRLRLFRRVKTL